jgi:stearoyl-CoA desaturase (Delta-9 desaturase)
MFFVTAGYHRYFSHRTYKTSRVGQAVLAFMAQTSAQKGAIWWASHHRRHHRLSDRPGDVHSPRQDGLFYAHVGWIFNHTGATDWRLVKDLARYPELVFLNRWYLLPPTVLAVAVVLLFGWSGLFIGFFASTVAVWHGTFVINSLAHVIGRRRFPTLDDSRNSVWLALVTFGEGWHNNHHTYMASTRQGFYWWEVDLSYYLLRAGAALGLVWGLREPPASLLTEGRARDRGAWRQPTVAAPGLAATDPAA